MGITLNMKNVRAVHLNGKNVRKIKDINDIELWPNWTQPEPSNNMFWIRNIDAIQIWVEIRTDIRGGQGYESFEYSFNGQDWETFITYYEKTQVISLAPGEYFYLRRKSDGIPLGDGTYHTTITTRNRGEYSVGGKLSYLLNRNTIYQWECSYLFGGGLVSADQLVLDIDTLTYSCYRQMFNCPILEDLPQIQATTLADSCFYDMFSGCTMLRSVPSNYLPWDNLPTACYSFMFADCTSLVNPPDLPAMNLGSFCYQYMFSGCTSLVEAPELPAETLVTSCYLCMFIHCTSLNKVICKSKSDMSLKDAGSPVYTHDWLTDVSPTGTFYKYQTNTTWRRNNYDGTWNGGIPENWSLMNIVEVITVNTNNCYWGNVWLKYGSSYYATDACDISYTVYTNTPVYIGISNQYTFRGWNDGVRTFSRQISTDYSYTYTAYFYEKPKYNITLNTYNSNGGKVYINDGEPDYSVSTQAYWKTYITAGAIPDTGYEFIRWSDNNVDSVRQKQVIAPSTLTAYFDNTHIQKNKYLCLTALSNSCKVGDYYYKDQYSSDSFSHLQYSVDGGTTWQSFSSWVDGTSGFVSMSSGQQMLLRGTQGSVCNNMQSFRQIRTKGGVFKLEGNPCSLSNNWSPTNSSAVPSGSGLYTFYDLFRGGTISEVDIYLGNFSLSSDSIYICRSMFENCTSLNKITCDTGNNTIIESNPFANWVNNISATGIFVKNSNATWSSGVSGIPSGWTVQTN